MKQNQPDSNLLPLLTEAIEAAYNIAPSLQDMRQAAMAIVRAYRDGETVDKEKMNDLKARSSACQKQVKNLDSLLDDAAESIQSGAPVTEAVRSSLKQLKTLVQRLERYSQDMQFSQNDLFYAAGFLNNLRGPNQSEARKSSLAIRKTALDMEGSIAHLRAIRNRLVHSM